MANERHIPVLLEETMSALAVRPGGRYVDGTLGRAGHSRAIVARGGVVLGIDRDEQALSEVAAMNPVGITAVKGEHADLKSIAQRHGWDSVDGVLLDLGVSSPQLDDAERGFSFMREGPLDMRMDTSRGKSAADIVNVEPAEELKRIFRDLGEEPQAARIAKAIERERSRRAFATTTELADFIERLVGRHGGHHQIGRASCRKEC